MLFSFGVKYERTNIERNSTVLFSVKIILKDSEQRESIKNDNITQPDDLSTKKETWMVQLKGTYNFSNSLSIISMIFLSLSSSVKTLILIGARTMA